MKQLNSLQSILFMTGGALMVVGVGCYVFMFATQIVCWIALVGCILFTLMQMMQTYEGRSLTIKRLNNILNLADFLFVFAGLLMVDNAYGFLRPIFGNQIDYITYVYNKWVVLLLIAAIIEVYAMHRIDHELKKEKQP